MIQEVVWNSEVFSQHISSDIDSMGLQKFYPHDDPHLAKLSETAAALTGNETNELNTGPDIANLASLALFDMVFYLGMLRQ